jgi:hypothetical protein
MASSGEKKYAHRRGKREVMNVELYDDHSILAEPGWQDAEQPWSSNTALQYVKLAFSNRMWPRECHAKNIERKSASWCDLVDIEVKWRWIGQLYHPQDLDVCRKCIKQGSQLKFLM